MTKVTALKTCSKCGCAKPSSAFYADKRHADGVRSDCKECFKNAVKAYASSGAGQEMIRQRNRGERYDAYQKQYRASGKAAEASRRYSTSKKGRETKNTYRKAKYQADPGFRTGLIHRFDLAAAIKAFLGKNDKLVEAVGCDIEFLVFYLEMQFAPGMSWDNYGHRTWHIDHKKPLAAFDLTDPEQRAQAFHFTNLQPLWAKENMAKGTRV